MILDSAIHFDLLSLSIFSCQIQRLVSVSVTHQGARVKLIYGRELD